MTYREGGAYVKDPCIRICHVAYPRARICSGMRIGDCSQFVILLVSSCPVRRSLCNRLRNNELLDPRNVYMYACIDILVYLI
jgi:hypothetical protein